MTKSKSKKEKTKKRVANKSETKADIMAKKQRDISVAEFFEKNRHLLGFDNKRKSLLTTVREAVDNALDACEEADILPEIKIQIIDLSLKSEKEVEKKDLPQGQTTLVTEEKELEDDIKKSQRYRVIVEDNGPGIVKKQIPNIFAKLLYGSKFHSLKQSRGQQGIGISAAALYGQLTTGIPIRITSKIGPKHPTHYYELRINTRENKPEILVEKESSMKSDHGTKIEIDLEGAYQKGGQSVDSYLKQTAISNPHVTIVYTNPNAEQQIYPKAVNEMPKEPKEIKPHPYGVELGRLLKMIHITESRTLQSFLSNEFSRVGSGTAKEICANAGLLPAVKPKKMTRDMAEKLERGIQKTKLMMPPTDCLSPIGAEELEKGLKKEIKAEFYAAITRPPAVYRGNPFIIEAGVAFGGDQNPEGAITLLRYANRVPLLYQQGACVIFKSSTRTKWKSYGLSQSKGNLPIGPATIIVHIASAWVPFTSESKEAIAHYPEIEKEIRLALQECGRKLSQYVHKKKRIIAEEKKRDYIQIYIPHVANALGELLKLKEKDEKKVEKLLKNILEKQRGKLHEIKVDASEFDNSLALEKDETTKEEEDGEEEKK